MKQKSIEATRDSVCMGDDCNAPNREYLDYDPQQFLSEWLLKTVTGYIPTMHNAIWVVYKKRTIIGYLICDEKGHYSVEIPHNNMPMRSLHIKDIYCRYFHEMYFKDKFSEYSTLLDKVKHHLTKT